jgi:hypothetical protein
LADANLVDQLAHLDAAKPETKKFQTDCGACSGSARTIRDSPLSGADERMRKALDALETTRKETKQANALLVELWKQSLQGEGIFWPRSFNATVEIVQGAPTGLRSAGSFSCARATQSQP